MNCACRTKPLRIFVQSLTELRFTDPVISRSVRPIHLGPPIALRRAPVFHPARLFSTSSAAYSPQQEQRDGADNTLASEVGEQSPQAPNDAAADAIHNGSSIPAPSVSGSDLVTAKQSGVILDYNPESIHRLVASLDRTLLTRQDATSEEHNTDSSGVGSRSQPRSKSPVMSSQLKRLKIIKEDKKQRNPEEAHVRRREHWQIQKAALKEKFPEGWQPRKRLSPDALEGIRALHAQFPQQYTTAVLSRHFEVSPDAIRRILKSNWTPNADEDMDRQERWFNRGKQIWSQMAALGTKPPRRWRLEGVVREPHWNKKKGPRTEYPYVPRRDHPEDRKPTESVLRKLSDNLV